MKKNVSQSLETIVEESDVLGLELDNIKGGGRIRCYVGTLDYNDNLVCDSGKWVK